MPACKPLLLALSIVLAAGCAGAQPLVVTHETLEARIAHAEHVVVGTVAKVTETVIAAPGGRASEGRYEYALVLKIDEWLKGNAKDEIESLRVIRKYAPDKRYGEWRDAKTGIVWFIAPPEKANDRGGWSTLRLGRSVPSETLYGQSGEPRLFSSDLTSLEGERAILDRARAYAKQSTKVLPTHIINMPSVALAKADRGFRNPWNHFVVPVDSALEPLAKRLIASPLEFVATDDKLDDLSRYQLRFGGVCGLRHFRSETNARLLRSLLDDSIVDIESSYMEPVPIRVKAFEILLEWGVETPLPKSPEAVTRINLANTAVTDESLKPLAGLTNLAHLDVSFTKVTHGGLKPLAGLKKLALIQLDDAQVTAALLGTLREMGEAPRLAARGGRGTRSPSRFRRRDRTARTVSHPTDRRGIEGAGESQEPGRSSPARRARDRRGAQGFGPTAEAHHAFPPSDEADRRDVERGCQYQKSHHARPVRDEVLARRARRSATNIAEVQDRTLSRIFGGGCTCKRRSRSGSSGLT